MFEQFRNKNLLFTGIVMAVIVVIMIVAIALIVKNESNRISEGIVIDKYYTSGYTRYSGDDKSRSLISEPPQYHLLLSGNKHGKAVKYWCEVTEDEYNSIKIGEFFKR